MAELALNVPERMLDFGTDHRDGAVDPRVDGLCAATLRRLAHHTPNFTRRPERRRTLGAATTLIGPDRGFLAVQQFIPDPAIVQFGGQGLQAVGSAAVHIHAAVGFHAEIPVIYPLGGRHLGVADFGLDLGRRWRIHQRARTQRDPLIGTARAYIGEDRLGQRVPLQQMAEVQGGGLVGDAVVAQFNSPKAAHCFAVEKALLCHRIAPRLPVLKKVDPQHSLQQHRQTTALWHCLRIMRRDQRHKPISRNHRIHLRQELLLLRPLRLHGIAQAGMAGCVGIGPAPHSDTQDYQITLKVACFSDVPYLRRSQVLIGAGKLAAPPSLIHSLHRNLSAPSLFRQATKPEMH